MFCHKIFQKIPLTPLVGVPNFRVLLGENSVLSALSAPGNGARVDGFLSFFTGDLDWVAPIFAHVAQSAERVLGKDEVTSSTLVMGSRLCS